jgi:hypothetical protein
MRVRLENLVNTLGLPDHKHVWEDGMLHLQWDFEEVPDGLHYLGGLEAGALNQDLVDDLDTLPEGDLKDKIQSLEEIE